MSGSVSLHIYVCMNDIISYIYVYYMCMLWQIGTTGTDTLDLFSVSHFDQRGICFFFGFICKQKQETNCQKNYWKKCHEFLKSAIDLLLHSTVW